VIVTDVPVAPDAGFRLVRLGGGGCADTVKRNALLASPPTVTTTLPVVAPMGTSATRLVVLQLGGVAAFPLNVTVLDPCVPPKFVPVIVTEVPTIPDVGLRLVRLGAEAVTVKLMPLLASPLTVATTFPVVAPMGTGATMLVVLQLLGVAAIPLNATVLVPCVPPKFVPVIVTEVPTIPDVGLRFVRVGADAVTVKVTPLLASPPTVATTFPVVAPMGTGAVMPVVLQLVGVAALPLNVTVLAPWVPPKFVPAIVTEVPTTPDVGLRLVRLGADAVTVKVTPLLASPLTVATTFPVVAPTGTGAVMLVVLQLVGVAAVPLNATVLAPCVPPKFVPVIVTDLPTIPDVGLRLVRLGADAVTVKLMPLLASPPTVATTFPVVAPTGAGAVMLVVLQLVGVAAMPLNVTVLVPCIAPKFVPAIVTEAPTTPDVGFNVVRVGGGCGTMNITPLLFWPPTVTTTFPVVAPTGTGATRLVRLQLVGVETVPLNVMVLFPWVAPKRVPAIVTDVPSAPDVGFRVARIARGTVNSRALLASPPTVTTRLPVVAPFGTRVTKPVSLQLVGVAAVPLNVTVLVPFVPPKLAPKIVTSVPLIPEFGLKYVRLGAVWAWSTGALASRNPISAARRNRSLLNALVPRMHVSRAMVDAESRVMMFSCQTNNLAGSDEMSEVAPGFVNEGWRGASVGNGSPQGSGKRLLRERGDVDELQA
jgi:hypothetical protein